MWYNQRQRLLRTFQTPQQLAEELYAMSGPESAVQLRQPLIIYQSGDQPAIELRGFENGDSLFRVTRGGVTFGDLKLNGSNLRFDDSEGNQSTTSPASSTGEPKPTSESSSGGGGIPGQISSGSGSTYTVTIYPSGLSGATESVTVTQLSIASGQSIDAGTWTMVTQIGSNYYMQVPVWQ